MTTSSPPETRRKMLRTLGSLTLAGAGLLAAARPRAARAVPAVVAASFPEGATLLVAGPAGSHADQWAALLTPGLARVLTGGPHLHRALSGGADGVTGANQFEARIEPDGSTALLLPGAAARSWLVGDPRAHFDMGPWVPVFAALTSGVLCARPDWASRPALRIAAASPVGAELPALLGLDLLGVEPAPLFGVLTQTEAMQRLAQGAVDAVFVQGRDTPQRVAVLTGLGAPPVFSLGSPDPAGGAMRDPLFPAVPHLAELFAQLHGAAPAGALYDAWAAAAAAAQLDAALVLPSATPAAMVAIWRRASDQSLAGPDLQQAAASMPARPLGTPGAAAALAAIATDAPALLELRRWLALRFGWRPV